jgi:hypothetical protein
MNSRFEGETSPILSRSGGKGLGTNQYPNRKLCLTITGCYEIAIIFYVKGVNKIESIMNIIIESIIIIRHYPHAKD